MNTRQLHLLQLLNCALFVASAWLIYDSLYTGNTGRMFVALVAAMLSAANATLIIEARDTQRRASEAAWRLEMYEQARERIERGYRP